MATEIIPGPITWQCQRDEEGHRTYSVAYYVRGETTDGPATALLTPGLPQPGDAWSIGDDEDAWATCYPTTKVAPFGVREGHPSKQWKLEFTFSTKPLKRCQDEKIEDPLAEPQKVSVSFVNYTEEATYDRFGAPVVNSAHEQIRGPQVEFDATRFSVKIEQNVAALELPLVASMRDCVNRFELWGCPPRTIKLTGFSSERKYWGVCSSYYSRHFEFQVRLDTFDRDLLDEGTKVLNGRWDASTGAWVLVDIGGIKNPAAAPTLVGSSTGGALAAGTYSYRYTISNANGETLPSLPASVITTGATSKVTVSWPATTGADGYSVYGRSGTLGLLDENITTLSFVDDGGVTPGGVVPITNSTAVRPDSNNPTHFIRFQDRQGNLARVILNGAGLPAGVMSGSGRLFISIAGGNTGNAITDTTKWLPLPSIEAAEWNEVFTYTPGDLVLDEALVYVALTQNTDSEPPSDDWHLLGPEAIYPNDQGNYDAATAYGNGDYVKDTTGTSAGSHHIEKYGEADFTLLGIPTEL